MAKIDADPESEDVKHTESVLWQKIYKKAVRVAVPVWESPPKAICLQHWDCVTALKKRPNSPNKYIRQ